MTVRNGSTEDRRMESTEKESANTEENREAKQLLYWPKYKLASDIKESSLFKEQNKILTLFLKKLGTIWLSKLSTNMEKHE